jgi:hypothetical protein
MIKEEQNEQNKDQTYSHSAGCGIVVGIIQYGVQ